MICADREFPEPATQLMLNGAELIVVPNACDWDEIRRGAVNSGVRKPSRCSDGELSPPTEQW